MLLPVDRLVHALPIAYVVDLLYETNANMYTQELVEAVCARQHLELFALMLEQLVGPLRVNHQQIIANPLVNLHTICLHGTADMVTLFIYLYGHTHITSEVIDILVAEDASDALETLLPLMPVEHYESDNCRRWLYLSRSSATRALLKTHVLDTMWMLEETLPPENEDDQEEVVMEDDEGA
jgi:hypothetical protein